MRIVLRNKPRELYSLKLLFSPLPLLTFSVCSPSYQHIPLSNILLFIALLKCLYIDLCPQKAGLCVFEAAADRPLPEE